MPNNFLQSPSASQGNARLDLFMLIALVKFDQSETERTRKKPREISVNMFSPPKPVKTKAAHKYGHSD